MSRLHSAPAAPQSREGGQRPSYFGSEENDGTNIYCLGSGELCPLNDSSGDDADAAGGKFPSQLLVDDKRDAEPSVAPAANGGRRKGRRANLARSSLDMGLIHAGENDWNVQGQSARDHSLEQAENRGRGARGKNRPARDTDHLGGRHPRPLGKVWSGPRGGFGMFCRRVDRRPADVRYGTCVLPRARPCLGSSGGRA